ncbi:MAG: TonB-dependent receptor [Ignavibacteriae bacterium]|nr:TonB-dependent receptor [Ignavibacteriota bacterium]
MKRNLLLLVIVMITMPIVASAGITGILSGKVVDEKGKPVGGASIRVKGTTRGGNAKLNGTFNISNINSGTYEILVKAVNYKDYTTSVRISADQTTEITIKMVESVVQTKEVTITAESEKKLVNKDKIGTNRTANGEDNTKIARETVQGVVALTAGVQSTGAGFEVRGSRAEETQIRVDGLDVGDQFTGSFGNGGAAYSPTVSSFAVEEVQVLTGSFSAEYGNALGGIVNTVVKSGRVDKYEGFARWRTDAPSLFGKGGNGIQFMGKDQNTYEFGAGGPIPLLEGSTFFVTGKYAHEQFVNQNNHLSVIDPLGNNLGRLPFNQSWVQNVTGRLKFSFSDISLSVGGQYGISSRERGQWAWLYANEFGVTNIRTEGGRTFGDTNFIPESQAKPAVVNNNVNNLFVSINHVLGPSTYYEFRVSTNITNTDVSKRSSFSNPSLLGGIETYKPIDEFSQVPDPTNPTRFAAGSDRVIDVFQQLSTVKPTPSEDGYYMSQTFRQRNSITGYYEGAADNLTTKNAYGFVGVFNLHGNERQYDLRSSNFLQFDGNFNTIVNSSDLVKHNIKAGFELRTFVVKRFQNSLAWESSGFYDVYTDEFKNPYADNETAKRITEQPKKPISGAVYLQDQISYKGIIINPGVRFDFTDPNSTYRIQDTSFTPITSDSGFAKTNLKYQISPRITIAYPITDRSILNFSYGVYFQMPLLNQLFDSYNKDQVRSADILGDPQIKAQRNNQYEIAYNLQLTDDFAFDVTAYYKENFNQVGLKPAFSLGTLYWVYTVTEYGSSRGLEFTLKKRATNNIGLNLNYTLASTTSTGASATANYNLTPDPATGKLPFPMTPTPSDGDRRHQLTAIVDFNWAKDEGPSIGGIKPLENVNLNLTTRFQTGLPYTLLNRKGGTAISENNSERQPSWWQTDMRFSKDFPLQNWFGEGMGKTTIVFFVDILNLFNRTDFNKVYDRSSDPDQDYNEYAKLQSSYAATTYYKNASSNNSASISAGQYDRFGNRMYSAQADGNGDGQVTQLETYQAYLRYVKDAQALRVNYQTPRQVFFGFMLQF